MVEPLRFAEMTESDRDAFIHDGRSPFDDCLDLSDTDDVLEKEVIGTASPPDCDKWAYSIEVLLDDPAGLEVFRSFLRSVRREESLSFWMAAKMFRDDAGLQNGGLSDNGGLQARSIFTQYLEESASQRVLIRDSTARKVGAALCAKKVAGDLFVEAQAEAVARMTERDYPEFLRSEIFRGYVEKASLHRQQPLDSRSDVLSTFPVNDNGESLSPPYPSHSTSLWPFASERPPPICDTHIAIGGTGDDNTASLSDMTSNKEESASTHSRRRQMRSKREAAAIVLDDLPRDKFTDELPRPRKPEPTYKPEEFFRLLNDRLKEVIRNRELPGALGGKKQLDDIQEQPEQTDHPHMVSDTDFLAVPPASSCISDVSSEGSHVSQVSVEQATQSRKERTPTPKRMPTDSGHHSDLLSSVEDLFRATSMNETSAQQRHRHLAQKRYDHLHHHNHLHHHYSGVPKDKRHHNPLIQNAASDVSLQKSKYKRAFASQSVLSESDPWAMASPDQRSVYSSSSAETLSLTYERRRYPASDTSSVVSYRSNPECHPMVYSCRSRSQYEPVSPSHMRARSQHPPSGHHYRSSSARGIEIVYKINGDKFKQYLPGPTVTLGDFKALVKGTNQYMYFFEVRDDPDPDPCFEEFRNDLDILPIYDGRIIGRLRPLRID